MHRFPDWPERLARFVRSRRHVPFDEQTNNCGLLVCDAVLEMTGVDMAGEWRTATDPLSLAKSLPDIAAEVAAQYELTEIPPAFAQRGDVLLMERDTEHGAFALGIMGFNGYVLFVADSGLVEVPPDQCVRAWRIP